MDAKEYLLQYQQSIHYAKEIEQNLHELKAESVNLKDHNGNSVALDEAVAKYVDACNNAGEKLNQLADLRIDIMNAINAVSNKKLRLLLIEVYINGKNLVRVAADREQSYEHICRLHGNALNAVRAIRPDLE